MTQGITHTTATAETSTRRLSPRGKAPPTVKSHKPVGVTKATTSKKLPKPDIHALRAKLILANSTLVQRQVKEDAKQHYAQQAQQPWLASATFKERHYVLDGSTWALKQYGQAWEAELVSSKNPPIDAGNSVWIYVRDDEKYLAAMKAFASASRTLQAAYRGSLCPPMGVVRRGRTRIERWRREVGVKRGSFLYLKVVEAVERIKAGEM